MNVRIKCIFEKNGGMKKSPFVILTLFLVVLFTQPLLAGDKITLTGSTKSTVRVGETFQVVYQLNAEAGSFERPDFGGLEVLSGPNVSSSSSISFVNGHMSQSYTVTYSFYVQAVKEGTFTIGPAAVKVNGKRVLSNKLTVKAVSAGSALPKSGNAQKSRPSGAGGGGSSSTLISPDDVFVKATVNNPNPYLGQQVIVTYEIYTKVPVSNLSIKKLSSFGGFWSKDLLDDNAPMKQRNKYINGEQYVVAEIRKLALIPQKTGKLTIDPMELDCNVQVRVKTKRRSRGYDPFEDFFDDPFFSRNVRNIKKTLRSNALTLNVKPLPEAGKPVDFSGAVGSFSFKTSLDKDSLTTNDALTLTVTIAGKGNIELIEAPEIKWPVDFDSYDPKVVSKINKSVYGVSGRKKFEYVAIPRNPGDYVVPPIHFSFFNPDDKQYHRFSSDSLFIHVVKGKGGATVTYSSNAQEDIHFLGKDIRHIKSDPGKLRKKGVFFFGTSLYYMLLALPVVLLIVTIVVVMLIRKRRGNTVVLKNKKAHKMAKNRLSKALKFKKAGEEKPFYDEVAQALWGYISDKFNIPQSELSMDTVKDKLERVDAGKETIETFINTLNDIEFARFAPGSAKDRMEQIYNEALEAILKAEKALR